MKLSIYLPFLTVAAFFTAPVHAQVSPVYTQTGVAFNEQLGHCVAPAGDVDNNGADDILIGVPLGSGGFGEVFVIGGPSGSVIYGTSLSGASMGSEFGRAVVGLGDLDNDNFDDFAVGAPGENTSTGQVVVYSGQFGGVLYTWNGPSPGSRFGTTLANAGDVNNDGKSDVLVGAPKHNGDRGIVQVFSGANGAILHSITGDNANDQMGFAGAGVGDLDNDNVDDFAVGAPFADANGFDSGLVRVLSGSTGSVLFEISGNAAQEQLGQAVAGIGDLNGDGRPEILVGVPGDATAGVNAGRVQIHSDSSGKPRYAIYGDTPASLFGSAVASAGDVDGDLVLDFIVGAYRDPTFYGLGGSVHVYSGAKRAVLFQDTGTDNRRLGFSVAGAGDFDMDGRDDVVFGAPFFTAVPGQQSSTNLGLAEVYSGASLAALEPGMTLCYGDGSGPGFCPCGNTSPNPTEGCAHSGGFGMKIRATGSTSILADNLMLTVTGLPPGTNIGLFYAGRTAVGSGAGTPLLDGIQCTGVRSMRYAPMGPTGTATATGFVAQDPTGAFLQPGATYVFQYYSRDAGGGPCGMGANFSPGYRVTMSP